MLFYVGNLGIAAPLLQQLFPEVLVVVAGFTEEKFATDRLGSLVRVLRNMSIRAQRSK